MKEKAAEYTSANNIKILENIGGRIPSKSKR